MSGYETIKRKLARGWNTWHVRSVLTQVLLPEGFAINLGFKEYGDGSYLGEALIGRPENNAEIIHPGPHTYDGSYTELTLKWKGLEARVQSAVQDGDLVMLVTPLVSPFHPATLVVEAGILWNREGYTVLQDGILSGVFAARTIPVYTTQSSIVEPHIPVKNPYFAVRFDQSVGISTGKKCTHDEIASIIGQKKAEHRRNLEKYGELAPVYEAMQTCLAWDTVYEPGKDRVISPVSRLWCENGYILFCWDTYFAGYMASLDNKELAYANVIEITREKTERGFVPNFARDTGFKSRDRSQPPVGSLVVRELYRQFRETWLLEEVFDDLYQWNTWFFQNRQVREGLLAWGSDPYAPVTGNRWETDGVGDTFGGALESGLDNSPMYDEIPFNHEKHCLELADVGLMGLYNIDCRALAEISAVLGRTKEAAELAARAEKISIGLDSLWDESSGLYLNRRTDTGEFSRRISPTLFYSLFDENVSEERLHRMIADHLYNPEEFWGEWVLPSIARNDPAFPDQDYWRGRIWAPMNFLVYWALQNHASALKQKGGKNGARGACRDLAAKSQALLLQEWRKCGHVHENYCPGTGLGCNSPRSDKFYHWGGLLGLMALIEAGFLDPV